MSGVKWPHQTSPRDLGSIVDSQVHLWEMRRDQPVDAPPDKATGVTSGAPVGDAQLAGKSVPIRHRWLHYWGDAIVAELTRLGQIDEHAEASLNDGLIEVPSNQPRASVPEQRRRRRWISRLRANAKSHKS